MAKMKTIKEYRSSQIGATTMEVPMATDSESQTVMELNFNNYINVLSDIVVRYSKNNNKENFKTGQIWVEPVSAYIKEVLIFAIYINKNRKVDFI